MRYFIGFLITLGLIIILILLLFSGGGTPKAPVATKQLASYASTDAVAQLTIIGKITSKQDHNQVRITVGRNQVTYQQMTGYNNNVVRQQSYANTEASYEAFLSALGHAGFTRGDKNPALANDSGYCPLGKRFVFQLSQGGKDIERYWTTTCGNPKTFLGSANVNITLFQNQIPNYNQLTNNVQF